MVEFVQTLGKEKRKSLLEKIQDRVSKLSDETLEKLPVDGAENLDHYLYGSPKNQIKTLNIHTILTHDNHFEQEGFTVLL